MDLLMPYGRLFVLPDDMRILGGADANYIRLLDAAKAGLTQSGARVPLQELFIGWGGQSFACAVRIIDTHPYLLALHFAAGDQAYYALACRIDGEWRLAPRLLGLPVLDPPEWGVGEQADRQRWAHLFAFVALGKLDRWLP